MTLPGGAADKLGNRYEKWWTLSQFVRMLQGETEAIRIEDPGVEKAEFVVATGSEQEFHQAKRSHPNGKWSLAALGTDLLQRIGNQLVGNNDQFIFASGSDARELSDLCEAANNAESVEEFQLSFLAAEGRKERFQKLCDLWACDVPTAFDCLRRIKIRTIGEPELEQKVRWGVIALFLAKPNAVMDALRGIAEDSVHRTISREILLKELTHRGYTLRRLRSPEHAAIATREATDRYLADARSRLIQQKLVPRAASQTLLSRLQGAPIDSVLTGRAGSGKTACVVEIVETLRERGSPVVAFRLDRIPSPSTTMDLGQRLGFEESPVLMLAAAAEDAERPGVLIVDQLDAVSTMSGRSSGAFDLVESLLHEARGTRQRATILTIVVCRAFDWMNDSRLRKLLPDSHAQVDVTEFAADEVKTILDDACYDPQLFREHQLELLRLPQNLSLFIEARFDTSNAPAFGTAKDLFDRYWEEKRKSVAMRVAPAPDQWMEVIKIICAEMTATQQLSLARETLDTIQLDYLEQLASEGVLTFDGGRCGFGHESFFDYCFARLFFTQSESLVSFLKESEQHLFRRAQARQVLVYLRDRDHARYVRELCNLLSDQGIRMHIKDLVFALLAEVMDPTDEEWAIWKKWMEPALNAIEKGTPNADKLSELAWQRFLGSSSWFTFADQHGMIEGWLASGSEELADVIVNCLKVHHQHSPDRATALLEPYANEGGEWVQRLAVFIDWAHHHKSRRLFDLFLRLVDNGTLDADPGTDTGNRTFKSMHHDLSKHRPEWVPEVLAHWLRRRLAVIRKSGEDLNTIEFFSYDRDAAETFRKSGERTPTVFVKHVLPVVLEISDFALIENTPPRSDAVWRMLIKTDHPSSRDACLLGTAEALATLASAGDVDLRDVIADLRSRETHVANHLLLALYCGGTARYADETVALLCDEPWRFQCGFSDNPNWCAMELIREMVPHCTVEDRERLETVILSYLSPFEQTSSGHRLAGQSRFALLSVIPTELRSTRAKAHFRELERKFSEPRGEPRKMSGGLVRSPIEKTAAAKMTDAQWLRAIDKYSSETRLHCWDDPLKGGAVELARELEAQVIEEPGRFARLSLKFPVDANPVYLERTLAALENVAIPETLKFQVCHKAFADAPGHCGAVISDVLGSIEDPLPRDAIRMLQWLATEHEDPDREFWQEDASGGQPYYGGDIHHNGINTTRGRASRAVQKLILADATYIHRFRSTLDRMIRDPSPSVLSCVAGTLQAVARHNPALAMALFRRTNLSEDRLLATRHVRDFIHGGLRDYFLELRPTLERMLRSCEPEVCEIGARLVGIASLIHREASDLADEALRGSGRHRLGIAQVASANVTAPDCRTWSKAMLTTLFNDEDPDVRRESASCFRRLEDETLYTYNDLITAFCDSRAYQENSSWILHTLENTQERLPGTTCLVCERFLDRFADDDKGLEPTRFSGTHSVAKLIFRTYQQHQNGEWTSRLLDLIDRLCLERIVDARREFEQFER